MIKRALERAHVARGGRRRATTTCQPAPAATSTTAGPRAGCLRAGLLLSCRLLLLRFGPRALGLDFSRLELGCDQRVVLRAQVDLVGVLGGDRAFG